MSLDPEQHAENKARATALPPLFDEGNPTSAIYWAFAVPTACLAPVLLVGHDYDGPYWSMCVFGAAAICFLSEFARLLVFRHERLLRREEADALVIVGTFAAIVVLGFWGASLLHEKQPYFFVAMLGALAFGRGAGQFMALSLHVLGLLGRYRADSDV